MGTTVDIGFLKYFEDLDDPRVNRGKLHQISEILLLTLAATMCGCESSAINGHVVNAPSSIQ